jgi:hypothetical protein
MAHLNKLVYSENDDTFLKGNTTNTIVSIFLGRVTTATVDDSYVNNIVQCSDS